MGFGLTKTPPFANNLHNPQKSRRSRWLKLSNLRGAGVAFNFRRLLLVNYKYSQHQLLRLFLLFLFPSLLQRPRHPWIDERIPRHEDTLPRALGNDETKPALLGVELGYLRKDR
jgi:hypothetical protein